VWRSSRSSAQAARRRAACSSTGRVSASTPSSAQHPHASVRSNGSRPCRHSWSASRPQPPGLDRAAPATLEHRCGVAGAEAVLAHRALPLEVQRGGDQPYSRPARPNFRYCQRVRDKLCERLVLLGSGIVRKAVVRCPRTVTCQATSCSSNRPSGSSALAAVVCSLAT
jgi:hypothetical protein